MTARMADCGEGYPDGTRRTADDCDCPEPTVDLVQQCASRIAHPALPVRVRVSTEALASLKRALQSGVQVDELSGRPNPYFGVPVVLDESLPPGGWEIDE